MPINLSHKHKIVAVFSALCLILLITGWTLARNSNPIAPATPPLTSQPQTASQDPMVKKVSDALAKQKSLKGEKINVESAGDGKVKLTGKVSNYKNRQLALKTAEKSAGKGNATSELLQDCSARKGTNPLCPIGENCCCDPSGNCHCKSGQCDPLKPAK